jgi:hypothetical protein
MLTSLGLASAGAVAAAVVLALGLLPVLLGMCGHRLVPRAGTRTRWGRRAAREPGGPSTGVRWTEGVLRRPVRTLILGTVALVALALPAMQLKLALTDEGNSPTTTSSRQAYDVVGDAFGPGGERPARHPCRGRRPGRRRLDGHRRRGQAAGGQGHRGRQRRRGGRGRVGRTHPDHPRHRTAYPADQRPGVPAAHRDEAPRRVGRQLCRRHRTDRRQRGVAPARLVPPGGQQAAERAGEPARRASRPAGHTQAGTDLARAPCTRAGSTRSSTGSASWRTW